MEFLSILQYALWLESFPVSTHEEGEILNRSEQKELNIDNLLVLYEF